MEITTKKELAQAYRQGPLAWPGGYPVYLLLSAGAVLCWDCFKSEYRQIVWDLDNDCDTGWKPAAMFVLWENDTDENGAELPIYCDHCSKELEAAYSDREIAV